MSLLLAESQRLGPTFNQVGPKNLRSLEHYRGTQVCLWIRLIRGVLPPHSCPFVHSSYENACTHGKKLVSCSTLSCIHIENISVLFSGLFPVAPVDLFYLSLTLYVWGHVIEFWRLTLVTAVYGQPSFMVTHGTAVVRMNFIIYTVQQNPLSKRTAESRCFLFATFCRPFLTKWNIDILPFLSRTLFHWKFFYWRISAHAHPLQRICLCQITVLSLGSAVSFWTCVAWCALVWFLDPSFWCRMKTRNLFSASTLPSTSATKCAAKCAVDEILGSRYCKFAIDRIGCKLIVIDCFKALVSSSHKQVTRTVDESLCRLRVSDTTLFMTPHTWNASWAALKF